MPMRSGNRPVTGIRIISVQGRMEQLWRGATFLMGLNGEIRPGKGILSIVMEARERGIGTCLIPYANKAEGALVHGIRVVGVRSLAEIVNYLRKDDEDAVDAELQELIDKRAEARKNKDWATADAIRDQLAAMGITLKDTPQGVQISRAAAKPTEPAKEPAKVQGGKLRAIMNDADGQ